VPPQSSVIALSTYDTNVVKRVFLALRVYSGGVMSMSPNLPS
jgi:hypothetical protein